ncbi:MAG: SH3 domain-containing protein [Rhodospirillaceae bacterium]
MAFAVRRLLTAVLVASCLAFAPLAFAEEADAPEEAPPAAAAAPGATTPSAIKTSGLPVPRFVAIRSNEVNARSGPSTQYPILWVFSRRSMPVEVVAEFDTWRRIRDSEGAEGWVMQGMLTAKRSVIVAKEIRTLRREPSAAARPVARAEPGVVAKLLRCRDEWCEIDGGEYRGWLKRSEVWGVYPTERLE